jgi:ADP-ribosylation factor GTPase-activating protein 1
MMGIFNLLLLRFVFPTSTSLLYLPNYITNIPHSQIAETDLAAQARLTAATVAKGAQTGAKSAADGFNRFVEGPSGSGGAYRQAPIDESKKDFWDSFAEAGSSRQGGGGGMGAARPSAIGTSAVRNQGATGGGMGGGGGGAKKDDDWDKW